ncbi:MAG TPA: hypothetical protein VKZ18_17775 [Polyangia bacterium]|nr:hypothetical protein [Polyangia bacterium]
MQAPSEEVIDGSLGGAVERGSGGGGGIGGGGLAGAGGGGAGGSSAGAGGAAAGGAGGMAGAAGTGGASGGAGTGGAVGAGGAAGAAGTKGSGGAGGSQTGAGGAGGGGGAVGTGGAAGAGGGGGTSAGGAGGSAGSSATGGGAGGSAGATAGAGGGAGAGGAAGAAGGHGGAGGYACPLGGTLDCSSAGALTLPGGQVTDFSPSQWNPATSQWCDGSGLRGRLYMFSGASPSAAAAAVDTTAQNLKLNLTAGATSYAGGGVVFESCVNASAFTSVQFTASITSGSLTGCVWQVQLQTQDQRGTTETDPSGGTCSSNCQAYPVVSNLAVPGATASTYTEAFTAFTNQSGSTIPLATQLTGIQWQVNSSNSGAGTCTVELRIDDIKFK